MRKKKINYRLLHGSSVYFMRWVGGERNPKRAEILNVDPIIYVYAGCDINTRILAYLLPYIFRSTFLFQIVSSDTENREKKLTNWKSVFYSQKAYRRKWISDEPWGIEINWLHIIRCCRWIWCLSRIVHVIVSLLTSFLDKMSSAYTLIQVLLLGKCVHRQQMVAGSLKWEIIQNHNRR